MQIVRGFVAPFRGALYISRHGLWGFLVAPFLLNLVIAVVAGWWAGSSTGDSLREVQWLTNWPVLGSIVSALATVVVMGLAFILLQPIFAAPFIDLLCERVEKIVRGHAPSAGVLRSVAQAIAHGLLKATLYAFALVITLVLGSLTGFGGLLGALLYGAFVAFDAFDYPLARRAISFSGKWRYLLSRPGLSVGYCCGAGLFYFVPVVALLAPPFAAVGATLVFLENEGQKQDGRETPNARP